LSRATTRRWWTSDGDSARPARLPTLALVTVPSAALPRVRLVNAPTPLEPMDRLAAHLHLPAGTLWVKRDDLTGLAMGGNKVRKLELVVADALAQGADWLVTGAGVQSNAARATAAAAARWGLGCTLVLDGDEPEEHSGNLVLDEVLGAELVFEPCDSHDALDAAIERQVDVVRARGQHPYLVAVGASTPLGALGYSSCATEIIAELPDVDWVVVGTGSAGTQAGLVAGFGDHTKVCGVRVGTRHDLADRVASIARDAAALGGLAEPTGRTWLDDDHLGEGYGAHTEGALEAIVLAARTEGLVLDPVYTGKSMAALIAACRRGDVQAGMRVVWVHTGGSPGLLSREHGPRVASWAAAHR
jgi:1-aminocyclopropane-1-carboxylate deaminase/D-cysteine desulfhydrase-like pyridoxal-dependent ACC family enzyme